VYHTGGSRAVRTPTRRRAPCLCSRPRCRQGWRTTSRCAVLSGALSVAPVPLSLQFVMLAVAAGMQRSACSRHAIDSQFCPTDRGRAALAALLPLAGQRRVGAQTVGCVFDLLPAPFPQGGVMLSRVGGEWAGVPVRAGAGGDNGIAKMWIRREISASSDDDQSHYLHPHPYGAGV
jgi:hypothetical protein